MDGVDSDNQNKPAFRVSRLGTPADGWKEHSEVYGSADQVFGFTNAQLVTYFVTRTADDGLPLGDFKSINSTAELFRCGHVQHIQVAQDTVDTFLKRLSMASMKLSSVKVVTCGITADAPVLVKNFCRSLQLEKSHSYRSRVDDFC